MRDAEVIARLEADGVLREDGDALRPTVRWQAAMARAAIRLQAGGAPWDLRLPIAAALVELWPELPDDEIARRIEALLPIEAAALAGRPAPGAGEHGGG
jgi:hypothetical protein